MKKQKNVAITNRVIPNLIWNLQRLPLSFLNNLRGRSRIKYGMTSIYKDEVLNKDDFRAPLRFGFTLIELLVVVLIIGILAAIALPQYQLSVEKSRMAEAIILLKTIASAHQYYYLTHGTYLNSVEMDKLDISIENNITPKMASRKQTQYFLYSPEISPTSGYLAAAKRLPSSTEDSEYPYWLGITQAEPDKIKCHMSSNIVTAAQRKLCEQINKTGKL